MQVIEHLHFLTQHNIGRFAIYVGGALSAKFIGIITALVSVHILTPEQFGQLSLVQTMLTIVPVLLNAGLRQTFHMLYFHNKHQLRHFLQNLINAYLVIALPLAILLLGISYSYFHTYKSFIALVIGYSFFHFFSELLLAFLRLQKNALLVCALQTLQGVIILGFSYLLVFKKGWHVFGILTAQLTGILFLCILSIFIAAHYKLFHTWRFDKESLKQLFTLSLPCVPSIMLHWVHASNARWFLAQYNLAEVGFLSLALTASHSAHAFILQPLAYTYTPHALSELSKNNANQEALLHDIIKRMKQAFVLGALLLCALGIALVFLGKIWLPITYHKAIVYVTPILFADLFFMCSYFVSIPFLHAQQSKTLLWFNAAAALINIVLNGCLVPFYGAWATVISLMCSQAFFVWLHLRSFWSVIACNEPKSDKTTDVTF